MIQPPHRSVTRFFVPLIDVLTLLFCIFLVMPLAKDAQDKVAKDDPKVAEERAKLAEAENRRLREENARLRGSQLADVASKVAVRILVMVPDVKPILYYHNGRQRVDLSGPDEVKRMVDNDQLQSGGRPWVYIIQYAPDLKVTPTEGQRREVFSWFPPQAIVDVEGHGRQ